MERKVDGTGAIDKAIDVLELVAESGGITAAEITSTLNMPAPTTYRLLRAWQNRGYLVVDGNKRYRVASKLLRLSSGLSSADLLRSGSQAILDRLIADIDVACAQVAILESDQAVFVARAARLQDSFRLDLDVGSVVALHSTALGKAIIAGHTPERARELISRIDLVRRTDSTISNAEALEGDCAEGAKRGYWTSIGEHAPDLWSVAATISGAWDGAVLGIGISEHMWRYSKDRLPAIGKRVQEAADELAVIVAGGDAAGSAKARSEKAKTTRRSVAG
jgi:IclR family acetate operon transcriptional repressor